MRKKIIFLSLFLGLILITSGCQKKGADNNSDIKSKEEAKPEKAIEAQDTKKTETNLSNWKTYKNEKFNYQIKYPPNWFFVNDYCCPPPPASVNFNNYSSKKLEYASHQMDAKVQGINIDCLYEGKIDEIGEVKSFRSEGIASKTIKINGLDAIRFEQDRGPGSSAKVITYYIVDGQQGCRVSFENTCTSCEDITSTFKF